MAETASGEHQPPPAGRRRVPLSAVLLTLLSVGIIAVQVRGSGDPELETPLFGLSFLLLDTIGLVLSTRAALTRRLEPAERRPWRFMAPALLLHTASTAGFAVAATNDVPAAEWVAILARILMAPFMLVAVLSFPMRRLTVSERYKLLLDVTTVAGGGFIVLWYFIIGPALTSGQSPQVAVSLAGFPLSDLILVFGVCGVLLRGGGLSLRHPLAILLAGLVFFLTADVYYSYEELQHRGADLSLGVRLWLLGGNFLVLASAAQQLRRATAARSDPTGKVGAGGVSHLPYVGLAVGYLLLLFATAREGSFFPWGGLVAGVIVMTGAVAVRQLIAMRENHKLVVTDSLTGLANRVHLRTRLNQVLGRHQPVAVLLIDLDGFKQVNDSLGHEAGDALLVAFAKALTVSVRPSDTAGRLGGDEFAVVLPDVTDVEQAGVVAGRILSTAAVPVRLGNTMMPIRGSIGIALARPEDDTHSLLHRADIAMYAAKRTGSHGWLAYTDAMEDKLGEDADLIRDLSAAQAQERLRLSYQPILRLADGSVTALEAELHWDHPKHGLLTSDVVLPIAERAGIITDLGMWVLDQTCRHVRPMRQATSVDHPMRANVRLHPGQLHRPDLVVEVLAVVTRAGLRPEDLVLQIPGGALVQDDRSITTLHELRASGVRIAVDDFTTGYASLGRLTRLPVDILTVDHCFVAELTGDEQEEAVAEAVIRLSRLLRHDSTPFVHPVTLDPAPVNHHGSRPNGSDGDGSARGGGNRVEGDRADALRR